MTALGKTIRLFLVDGSPLGLITAEIMNWTGKVLSFPRGLLPDALKRPELAKTGVYFLVGPDPENPFRPLVYVGESDDVAKRLKQHDADDSKDFFEQVALIVSKDENLTKSHVRYLESRLIEIMRRLGTCTMKNGNQGAPVNLPEAEKSDIEYILQQLQVLMPVLGFTFLQDVPKPSTMANKEKQVLSNVNILVNDEDNPVFELNFLNGQIIAEAYEAEGQFIIKTGSKMRNPQNATPSTPKYYFQRVEQAKLMGAIEPFDGEPEVYILIEEVSFKSPSAAATFICGTSVTGTWYWKVKGTNQTYKEWRQAQVEAIESPTILKEEAFV